MGEEGNMSLKKKNQKISNGRKDTARRKYAIEEEVLKVFGESIDVFTTRNRTYGNNFMKMGGVLSAMFPGGLLLNTTDDFNRFCLFVEAIGKLSRYSQAFADGKFHNDSVKDSGVYSFMLEALDRTIQQKIKKEE
jgi:hypothetical protein